MEIFTVKSRQKEEVIDISDRVEDLIKKKRKKNGLCHLFISHTTAGLTTADLDPGTDLDMLDAFREMLPNLKYRHPHDPSHVGDHILSSLIGSSLTLPFENGRLTLGTWQRVVLIEFNGPRERRIRISLTAEK